MKIANTILALMLAALFVSLLVFGFMQAVANDSQYDRAAHKRAPVVRSTEAR